MRKKTHKIYNGIKQTALFLTVMLLCVFAGAGCGVTGRQAENSAGDHRVENVVQDQDMTQRGNAAQEENATQEEYAAQGEDAVQSDKNVVAWNQDGVIEAEKMQSVPIAGVRTIANLLLTAKQPLGATMYVWGGGWNEADTAAGEEACSIGVSPRWQEFAQSQDASYDYRGTKYQIHDGLDCSGYVGWVIYNVFEQEDGQEGYVMKAQEMAQNFAERGWGTYIPADQVTDWRAGDIMSMKGHVWIALGTCGDGSVVLMHASPPGVILCGTELENGGQSQATALAEQYMSIYYQEWYERYPNCTRGYKYLADSAQMRWNAETLRDEEGLTEMSAEEVLRWMFGGGE